MINRLLFVLAGLFVIGVVAQSVLAMGIVFVALIYLLLDSMFGGPAVKLDYQIALSNMIAAEADDPS